MTEYPMPEYQANEAQTALKRISTWAVIVYTYLTFTVYEGIWFFLRRKQFAALSPSKAEKTLKVFNIMLGVNIFFILCVVYTVISARDLSLFMNIGRSAYRGGSGITGTLFLLVLSIVANIAMLIYTSLLANSILSDAAEARGGERGSGALAFFFNVCYIQYRVNVMIAAGLLPERHEPWSKRLAAGGFITGLPVSFFFNDFIGFAGSFMSAGQKTVLFFGYSLGAHVMLFTDMTILMTCVVLSVLFGLFGHFVWDQAQKGDVQPGNSAWSEGQPGEGYSPAPHDGWAKVTQAASQAVGKAAEFGGQAARYVQEKGGEIFSEENRAKAAQAASSAVGKAAEFGGQAARYVQEKGGEIFSEENRAKAAQAAGHAVGKAAEFGGQAARYVQEKGGQFFPGNQAQVSQPPQSFSSIGSGAMAGPQAFNAPSSGFGKSLTAGARNSAANRQDAAQWYEAQKSKLFEDYLERRITAEQFNAKRAELERMRAGL